MKPTESRTVEEARTQPTPGDAAKAILKSEGKDPVALMAAMKVSKKDMTYPVAGGTQAVMSNLAALTAGPVVTRRGFAERIALGGRQVPVVGSPAQVADEMQGWTEEADLDGFVLARTVTPECFVDFVDLAVPELQRRGVYKTTYAEGTLRQKLFAAATRGNAG